MAHDSTLGLTLAQGCLLVWWHLLAFGRNDLLLVGFLSSRRTQSNPSTITNPSTTASGHQLGVGREAKKWPTPGGQTEGITSQPLRL